MMQEIGVNSTVIQVYRPRKKYDYLRWKQPIGGEKDLLDLLRSRIEAAGAFCPKPQRLDSDQPLPQDPDDDTKKEVELIPFDGSFCKGQKILSRMCVDGDTELYRYLYFTVTYGENGLRGELRKSDGNTVEIEQDDVVSQRFHVFIAYLNHPKTRTAVMLTESHGRSSVADVMRRWVRSLLSSIEESAYTVDASEFIDPDAWKAYIEGGQLEEVILTKRTKAHENGELPDYKTEVRTYKLDKKRPLTKSKLARVVRQIALTQDDSEIEHVAEIEDFKPDKIQIRVKGENNRYRTLTIDRPYLNGVRQVLPPRVAGPDGYTDDKKMLSEFKHIFEQQHLK